jgi:hypothetical protein
MGRKRGLKQFSQFDSEWKRARVEEQRVEVFECISDNTVEIDDPRNNTPSEIVKKLWHCLTASNPASKPSRNTEKKYRKQVFDWWDSVKESKQIRSSLVRARLLNFVKTDYLKKLGLLDILYESHCPSATSTVNETKETAVCDSLNAAVENCRRVDLDSESALREALVNHSSSANLSPSVLMVDYRTEEEKCVDQTGGIEDDDIDDDG